MVTWQPQDIDEPDETVHLPGYDAPSGGETSSPALLAHVISVGPEYSTRYRLAATYGREFERYIIADFEWGTEAYQFIAEDVSIADFDSQIVTLTWREWLAKDWGFSLRGEFYQSDEYNRTGIEISVFKHY